MIRKLLPYTTAAMVAALLYLVWVFGSRWNRDQQIQRGAEAKKAEAAQETLERLNHGKLKVTAFYATPGVVGRGQAVALCYGVLNATVVRIEPGVEPVKPSLSRCVEVKPAATTTYRISAEGANGETAAESVTVRVE